jgi:hypothetical protein
VTELEFTGFSQSGAVLHAVQGLTPALRVTIPGVPAEVRRVRLDYFVGSSVVARFERQVTLTAGGVTEVPRVHWLSYPYCDEPKDDSTGQFGADPDALVSIRPFALPPRALNPSPSPCFSPLPTSHVVPSPPPVGMQGTDSSLGYPGSCLAWAFAYGLGSYTAAQGDPGRDLNCAENLVSSAFMYELVLGEDGNACGHGTNEQYLPHMVLAGAPSAADQGYCPDCCFLNQIDTSRTYGDESRFALGSFYRLPLPKAGVPFVPFPPEDLVKEFLAADQLVAYVTPVYYCLKELPLQDGVFYGSGAIPCSGHAMLLVGYDDGLGKASDRGAFLVQNSFGTQWPPDQSYAPPGQFWLSYDTFFEPCQGGTPTCTPLPSPTCSPAVCTTSQFAEVAYPRVATQPQGVVLTPDTSGAPVAVLTASYQWTHAEASEPAQAFLILQYWFGSPVELASVAVTDPSGHSATQANHNYPTANGYAYFLRRDGYSWQTGNYDVTVEAVDPTSGATWTYTGTVSLGGPVCAPALPPKATPSQVWGTTLEPATVKKGPAANPRAGCQPALLTRERGPKPLLRPGPPRCSIPPRE